MTKKNSCKCLDRIQERKLNSRFCARRYLNSNMYVFQTPALILFFFNSVNVTYVKLIFFFFNQRNKT